MADRPEVTRNPEDELDRTAMQFTDSPPDAASMPTAPIDDDNTQADHATDPDATLTDPHAIPFAGPHAGPERTLAMENLGELGGHHQDDPTRPITPEAGGATGPTDLERTASFTAVPHAHHPPPATPHAGSQGGWGTIPGSGQLEPGQVVFGRYVVKSELGRGGMGRVWLVRHLTLDADRALKTIVATIAFDPEARARFGREARAMARFNHPNAVTVHDALLTEDIAFIEMEFVRGQSLDKVFERGRPMPLEWVERILGQLCDVLQVAHDSGIVHRDLKPSNLMLLDGREPGREHLKVLDFGIAKILDAVDNEADAHTMTNTVMGTPPYMSPEQAEGRSPEPLPDGRADGRGDLYSVGVILYEFLTGQTPFRGSMAKRIADTLTIPAPPFREVNPNVQLPAAIEAVVLRCLEKDPARRPPSARELHEAFAAAMPTRAETLVAPLPASPPTASKRWSVPVAAVVGVTLLGLTAAWQAGLIGPGVADVVTPVIPTNGGGEIVTSPEAPPGWLATAVPLGFVLDRDETDVLRFLRDDETRSIRLVADFGASPPDAPPPALVREADGVVFRRIERGSYTKGGLGLPGAPDPSPGREVTVSTLYAQAHEVTNGEFRRFLDEVRSAVAPTAWRTAHDRLMTVFGLSPDEADLHPAVGVPHDMASAVAAWAGGRLPTSTEWEYIARSQGRDDRPFVWGESPRPEINSIEANIDAYDRPGAPTTRVGYFAKDQTDQGVFDLTGNVREWTSSPAPGEAVRAGEPPRYLVRGGSWRSNADLFLTTADEPIRATETLPDLGFRVVLDIAPEAPPL